MSKTTNTLSCICLSLSEVVTDVGETSDNTGGSCIQQPLLPQSSSPDAEGTFQFTVWAFSSLT